MSITYSLNQTTYLDGMAWYWSTEAEKATGKVPDQIKIDCHFVHTYPATGVSVTDPVTVVFMSSMEDEADFCAADL
jgi:hypothetical protein